MTMVLHLLHMSYFIRLILVMGVKDFISTIHGTAVFVFLLNPAFEHLDC